MTIMKKEHRFTQIYYMFQEITVYEDRGDEFVLEPFEVVVLEYPRIPWIHVVFLMFF